MIEVLVALYIILSVYISAQVVMPLSKRGNFNFITILAGFSVIFLVWPVVLAYAVMKVFVEIIHWLFVG